MCKQHLSIKPTSRGGRIWLEGPRNTKHQFIRGARYTRTIVDGVITMTLDPEGKLKVAGKGSHPIIDYSAKQYPGLVIGQDVVATYTDGQIVIVAA